MIDMIDEEKQSPLWVGLMVLGSIEKSRMSKPITAPLHDPHQLLRVPALLESLTLLPLMNCDVTV